jgi:hypothetical protein
MLLLPVFPHSLDTGGNGCTWMGTSLALQPIGINGNNGDRVVQFPGDVYCLGVLNDIRPLGNLLCNGFAIPGLHGMLGLEVGCDLLGMDPMPAISTNNNL